MPTYVTRLFVGSGTNAGSLASPAAGDIYLVDQTGTRLTTAAAAVTATAIKVVGGVAVSGTYTSAITSPLITRADLNRVGVGSFTEQAYQAPTQQVDTISFANYAAGDTVRVRVDFKVNRKLQQGRNSIQEVYHTFTAGSNTSAELDKIVAKINSPGIVGQAPAVFSKYIQASNDGNGNLVLTGKTPPATGSVLDTPDEITQFQSFVTELVPQGSYGQGTIYPVTSVAANPGSGTAVQVKFEEIYEAGAYGRTDLRSWDRGASLLNSVANGHYDYIRLSGYKSIPGDLEGIKHTPIRNSLALPTGSAQATEAQTVIRAFVSGLATGAPAGE